MSVREVKTVELRDNREARRRIQRQGGKRNIRVAKYQPIDEGPMASRPCLRCWSEGRGPVTMGLHKPDAPWECPDGVVGVEGQQVGIYGLRLRPFRRKTMAG